MINFILALFVLLCCFLFFVGVKFVSSIEANHTIEISVSIKRKKPLFSKKTIKNGDKKI